MNDPLLRAREALLNLVADAKKWEEDVDGDADDAGRVRVSVTYHISTDAASLRELCEAVGIKLAHDETPGDALKREIEK